jgi:hypothetical protein
MILSNKARDIEIESRDIIQQPRLGVRCRTSTEKKSRRIVCQYATSTKRGLISWLFATARCSLALVPPSLCMHAQHSTAQSTLHRHTEVFVETSTQQQQQLSLFYTFQHE